MTISTSSRRAVMIEVVATGSEFGGQRFTYRSARRR